MNVVHHICLCEKEPKKVSVSAEQFENGEWWPTVLDTAHVTEPLHLPFKVGEVGEGHKLTPDHIQSMYRFETICVGDMHFVNVKHTFHSSEQESAGPRGPDFGICAGAGEHQHQHQHQHPDVTRMKEAVLYQWKSFKAANKRVPVILPRNIAFHQNSKWDEITFAKDGPTEVEYVEYFDVDVYFSETDRRTVSLSDKEFSTDNWWNNIKAVIDADSKIDGGSVVSKLNFPFVVETQKSFDHDLLKKMHKLKTICVNEMLAYHVTIDRTSFEFGACAKRGADESEIKEQLKNSQYSIISYFEDLKQDLSYFRDLKQDFTINIKGQVAGTALELPPTPTFLQLSTQDRVAAPFSDPPMQAVVGGKEIKH